MRTPQGSLTRAVLVAVLSTTAACAALIGIPEVPEIRADSGAVDGPVTPVDASAPGCQSALPPSRPTADDPSSESELSFVVAMRKVDIGSGATTAGPSALSYDLDRVFTCCDGGGASCRGAAGATQCDDDGGVDNSGGKLLAELSQVAPIFSDTEINQRIDSGLYTLLFQVQHYNGKPNDTSVTLSVLASRGIDLADGGTPTWDGSDSWTVDSDFVLGDPATRPIVPGRFDAKAYVSGGVLVAALDFPLSLGVSGGNTVTVSITGGVVTARVVDAGGGAFRLEGARMAGRWPTRAILAEFPSIYVLGSFVCPGSATYDQLKARICKAADLRADPSRDGVNDACDALSVGLGFNALPAVLGRVVAPTPKPVNCPDAAADDCPKD